MKERIKFAIAAIDRLRDQAQKDLDIAIRDDEYAIAAVKEAYRDGLEMALSVLNQQFGDPK